MLRIQNPRLQQDEDPVAVGYSNVLDAMSDLQNAYEKFVKEREEILDYLLSERPRIREEEEIFTADDLEKYIGYLQDEGLLNVFEDRDEWNM